MKRITAKITGIAPYRYSQTMTPLSRFKFIGHALNGDGPFRPTVSTDGSGNPITSGETYLIKYPRESVSKFNRRNELAFYSSPLSRVTSSFTSHIASRPVARDMSHELMTRISEDVDGKGNSIDVFWQSFMYEFKARGSMLLLIDMPQTLPDSLQEQLAERAAPYWSPVLPESLVDFALGQDGKFDFAEFSGNYADDNGDTQKCTWRFDRESWSCLNEEGNTVSAGDHMLGECPLLIATEAGDFPNFGPFAPIADLSKRLFNLDSELDEILRAQTFSLLTLQVPEESSDEQRMEAARTAGSTISTENMLLHAGSTPTFIAPDSGPASTYMSRIADIRDQINELGLMVATPNQRESGVAMQMRFQTINAELSRFSERMESLEARAWALSAKWLSMEQYPQPSWPRDFNIADPEQELDILRGMQETAMPDKVIGEQQKRVVVTQFTAMDQERQEDLLTDLDSNLSET